MPRSPHVFSLLVLAVAPIAFAACSSPKAGAAASASATSSAGRAPACALSAYVPKAASSAKPPEIPDPPTLPALVRKDGDAWTVAGLTHDLRSDAHSREVDGAKVTVVGYIVRTNLVPCKDKSTMDGKREQCVPECAVHPLGKGDPEGCRAPYPSFSLADRAGDTTGEVIRVLGWATNFAVLESAITVWDKQPSAKREDRDFLEKLTDPHTTIQVPFPLPAVGAKVSVTGTFGAAFTRGASVSVDRSGILTYDAMRTLEPAPELANLPTLPPRKKDEGK